MPRNRKRRTSDKAAFAMSDETNNTHRPKHTHDHLITEVIEQPHYDAHFLYQLTRPLTRKAHKQLGIKPMNPRLLV